MWPNRVSGRTVKWKQQCVVCTTPFVGRPRCLTVGPPLPLQELLSRGTAPSRLDLPHAAPRHVHRASPQSPVSGAGRDPARCRLHPPPPPLCPNCRRRPRRRRPRTVPLPSLSLTSYPLHRRQTPHLTMAVRMVTARPCVGALWVDGISLYVEAACTCERSVAHASFSLRRISIAGWLLPFERLVADGLVACRLPCLARCTRAVFFSLLALCTASVDRCPPFHPPLLCLPTGKGLQLPAGPPRRVVSRRRRRRLPRVGARRVRPPPPGVPAGPSTGRVPPAGLCPTAPTGQLCGRAAAGLPDRRPGAAAPAGLRGSPAAGVHQPAAAAAAEGELGHAAGVLFGVGRVVRLGEPSCFFICCARPHEAAEGACGAWAVGW